LMQRRIRDRIRTADALLYNTVAPKLDDYTPLRVLQSPC
jgi:hypothetical protein